VSDTDGGVALKGAYFHCIGGASGDMLLGAMVDAGLRLESLEKELAKLPFSGYRLEAHLERRCHLTATCLTVGVPATDPSLSPRELLESVDASGLEEKVKQQAVRVLQNLVEAECRVHRVSRDELTLHELGSMDTVIDVVGTVVGLGCLGIDKVFSSQLVVGTVQPDYPREYPVPAPATLELASIARAPIAVRLDVSHEMTTPTGAALLTTLADFRFPNQFRLDKVSYGAGAADLEAFPNVLGLWIGELEGSIEECVVLLETNLDDIQGIVLGYVQERLLAEGALDVWLTTVQMKKNRPGIVLSALVPSSLQQKAIQTILRETPTLGVRVRNVDRQVARRESVEFKSRFGSVMVKVKYLECGPVSVAPEYEDCRRLALETGMPFWEVYQEVLNESTSQIVP
jgi:uncharacterized protein (TIGR00299 family) protein